MCEATDDHGDRVAALAVVLGDVPIAIAIHLTSAVNLTWFPSRLRYYMLRRSVPNSTLDSTTVTGKVIEAGGGEDHRG
jgi:hypothetical protein